MRENSSRLATQKNDIVIFFYQPPRLAAGGDWYVGSGELKTIIPAEAVKMCVNYAMWFKARSSVRGDLVRSRDGKKEEISVTYPCKRKGFYETVLIPSVLVDQMHKIEVLRVEAYRYYI